MVPTAWLRWYGTRKEAVLYHGTNATVATVVLFPNAENQITTADASWHSVANLWGLESQGRNGVGLIESVVDLSEDLKLENRKSMSNLDQNERVATVNSG
jgi:hypothetical protein